MKLWILMALGACTVWPNGTEGDPREILEGLQRRFGQVQSVSGQFTQVYRAPGVEQRESGVFFMKRPGRMRWEYQVPETKLFVADGQESYFYTPEDGQVLIQPLSERDLRGTPLEILIGEEPLDTLFIPDRETRVVPQREGSVLLRLRSRSAQPEFEFIVVECDPRSFDLHRILIRESTGNLSEFVFEDLRTDVRIRDSQFKFKPPRGVEIIRIDPRE